MRRLQASERRGLVQRTISAVGCKTYNRINPGHSAHRQILALGKKLGELFTIPSRSERVETRFTWAVKSHRYEVLDMLADAANLPVRGEILLLLAALGEAVPISRLSEVLSRARYSVESTVNALESFAS